MKYIKAIVGLSIIAHLLYTAETDGFVILLKMSANAVLIILYFLLEFEADV